MIGKLSIKTLQRSKTKSTLLAILIMLVTLFCIMGVSMYYNSVKLLEQADQQFQTVAVVEYTAGHYPDEKLMTNEILDNIGKIDKNLLEKQEEVRDFHTQTRVWGYVDGASTSDYFKPPYINYSVITFKVMYIMEDGVYRCVLLDNIYGKEYVSGLSFGLSQEVLSKANDYKLEQDHCYLACGDFRNDRSSMIFSAMDESGIQKEKDPAQYIKGYPFVDITEQPNYMTESSDMKYWNQLIDFYTVQNGSFSVVAVDELETQTDFFLGLSKVMDGRCFTKEEAKSGEKVCVINNAIASNLEVNVGDTIPLKIHYSEDQTNIYQSYFVEDGFADEGEYKIVGIYDMAENSPDKHIYVPKNSIKNLPKNQLHYAYANILLENGASQAYESKISDALKGNVRIQVYDQGYANTVAPIKAMKTNSIFITLISFICASAVLLLFATIHITKQRESVAIFTALGTGKKLIQRFLSTGTYILAGTGCVIGGILGYIVSERVAEWIYKYSINQYSKDLRFSNLTLGVQKEFQGQLSRSILLCLGIALVVFLITAVICRISATKLIEQTYCFGGNKPKKKKKNKEKTKEISRIKAFHFEDREVDVSKKAFKKRRRVKFIFEHSGRSIIRNANVSFLMVLIPMCSAIFMLVFSHVIDNYEQAKEEAYNTIPVNAYFVTPTGKNISYHKIGDHVRKVLEDSNNVKNSYHSGSIQYEYVGKIDANVSDEEYTTQVAALKKETEQRLAKPATIFALESKVAKLEMNDQLFFTQQINRSKEFFGDVPPIIEYKDGYPDIYKEQDVFLKPEGEHVYETLVETNYMKEQNIQYGDTLAVGLVDISYVKDEPQYTSSFALLKVVGSYHSLSGTPNFYTTYEDNEWIDYVNYELKDTKHLNQLRDDFEEIGARPVGYFGRERISMVIEDKELVQTIENLDNTILFLTLLRYVLFGLIVIIGFVTAYLSMRTRQKEVAMIRSMGTGLFRTFFLFFQEQAVVTFVGSVVGTLLATIYTGTIDVAKIVMIIGLFLCYMLGSGICIMKMNQNNVLSILSVSE